MRSLMRALCTVALTALALSATAQAASPPSVHVGVYAAKETTVEAHTSSAVDVIVVDRGKRAKDVGVACSSGPSPAQGIRPETTLTVHVPGTLAISRSGSLSYSGVVTLDPEDTQSEVSATSSVSLKAHFTPGKIVKDKTIALKGTFAASVCAASTPASFSLIWDTASTAT
jgi:hypothetical protein